MYSLLKNRRSIRKYKEEKVDEGVVKILLKSILRSPSGNNINPWEVIYINDKKTISKLSASKAKGAKFLTGTSQCLLILADQSKTDVWIEDASIAATIAHLAAESLGLGSCWIQIRNRFTSDGISSEEYVRELMGIPEKIRVEAIISFGYTDEEKKPRPEEALQLNKIFINGYGKNYF